MTEFEFNLPLDDALFSVEPPKGYKVRSMDMDASPPGEEDLVRSLRLCAEANDGRFPDELNQLTAPKLIAGMMTSKPSPTEEETQELMQQAAGIARGLQFAITQPIAEGFPAWYAGNGVQLGEADRPIFWYRPQDAANFRVIYGDLSVKETTTAPEVDEVDVLHAPSTDVQ